MSKIIHGDSLVELAGLEDASVDAVVTDPPYGLSGHPDMTEMLAAWISGREYSPGKTGFMGREWDKFVPGPAVWKECLRMLKPGGYALVFAGSRTQDLMGLALRMAGFEIRDSIAWLYGTGYPAGSSNTDVAGEKWGTRLKPGHEPVLVARKPLEGLLAEGSATGRYNIDACRVPVEAADFERLQTGVEAVRSKGGSRDMSWGNSSDLSGANPASLLGRWPANVALDEEAASELDATVGPRKGMSGGGKHRPGYQESMFGGADASEGHVRGDVGGASRFFYCAKASSQERERGLESFPVLTTRELVGRKEGSRGTQTPAAGAGRGGGRRNPHPTVKPVALMEWLVRMVTQPGGLVLDPFCGSGTTGIAAKRQGFHFVGIEREWQYVEVARARIEAE